MKLCLKLTLMTLLVPFVAEANQNDYGQYYNNNRRAKRASSVGDKQSKSIQDNMKKESKNGVNNDANLVADQSGAKSGMNAAMGAALIAAGMAPKPPIMPLVMMGIMAMMQSGADSGQQGYAMNTGYDAYNGADGSKSTKKGNGLSAGQQRQFDEAKQALEDAGGKVNSDGSITTASGATLTGADFQDPDGLADKGFDGQDIAAAKDGLGIVGKIAKTHKLSYGGGGGGGSKGFGSAPSVGDDGSSLSAGNSLLNELNRTSSVAGMTRSLASDRIGVAGDNIFDMISRRYQAKKRARAFLP